MTTFPLSPLMHGGAQAGLLMHLFAGHLTILEPKFDPKRTWELIDENGVMLIFMTGDAMARPLIEEFERMAAAGTPYDGSSLFAVSSSAAIFSPEVKERWIKALPNPVYTDSVGASETGFQGMGMQDKEHISNDGPVVGLGPNSVVIDEMNNLLDVTRDVGKIGRLGRGGSVPVGYYKDPEKSAATFLEIDGQRYSVPGDFARIEEGGRVTLLGRGSNCVNTGGEKVYPEEVEMAIKRHPAVLLGLLRLVELAQRLAGVEVDAAAQHPPEVLVAPHHALREAGGPAGVDDVQVVGAALGEVALGALAGDGVGVQDAAVGGDVGLVVGVDDVGKDHDGLQRRVVRHALRNQRGVGPLVDQCDDVGVVEEVVQLALDVPVVHVDVDRADLHHGEDRDHVLDAVLGVHRDMVAGADSLGLQVVREPVGLDLELGVRHRAVADLHSRLVGRRVHGMLEEVCDVQGHGAILEHVLVCG
jgi:acyl-CoA synthetase (AMP-forming)/AMP-acid ligase II